MLLPFGMSQRNCVGTSFPLSNRYATCQDCLSILWSPLQPLSGFGRRGEAISRPRGGRHEEKREATGHKLLASQAPTTICSLRENEENPPQDFRDFRPQSL